MELTLKRLLEQAEFTLAKSRGSKGYDQVEVDEFLDRASSMAAKVEVQLTQALEQASGALSVDIEAEVERRVGERLAAEPARQASEEESAEEVRRTIVLAQRTADAAVREAREDAEKLLADARERATTMVADAESKAAALSTSSEAAASTLVADAESTAAALAADGEAQAARERREARQRLAAEIGELEGLRESLRSDVTVLERHLEEQRGQLGSSIGELQRLLDDPTGFRMAPVPVLMEPEIPDLAADVAPAPTPTPEPPEPPAAVEVEVEPPAPEAPEAPSSPEEPEASEQSGAPDVVVIEGPAEPSAAAAQAFTFDEVDHEAPDLPLDLEESGPPTAPVAAVDLGIDLAEPSPKPPAPAHHDDDAFLAELRKAMADDEPLGPRDHDDQGQPGQMFDEDRRSWRFGRRR